MNSARSVDLTQTASDRTFPKIADPDTHTASAYRVYGIPTHFFIDRTGVLRLGSRLGPEP